VNADRKKIANRWNDKKSSGSGGFTARQQLKRGESKINTKNVNILF
jgi:hypothetical protein